MAVAQLTAVQGRDEYSQQSSVDTLSAKHSARMTIHYVGNALMRQSADSYSPVADNLDGTLARESKIPDQGENRLAGIVDIPARREPATSTTSFYPLQEWEGYVTEIAEDGFTARLLDLTTGATYEEEEADFPLEEVSEGDATKMRVGSVFRWVIGYERSVAGTKRRVSQIVFRDLPAITKTDLQSAEDWALGIMAAWKE